MALYEIALMGAPTDEQVAEVRQAVSDVIEQFGLHLDDQVTWSVRPATFNPPQTISATVAFFGGPGTSIAGLPMGGRVPILPIVSGVRRVHDEIPSELQILNCLPYSVGPERIATALLECVGLLPRQRRVFVSYRRTEAREAALQLFDAFSARLFDVFLDTHGVPPAVDFQQALWHRLCDSDVLVMLDTDTFFESRWTAAEYGRALAKQISVLRVGWPHVKPSPRTLSASRIDLTPDQIDPTTGRLSEDVVTNISNQLELVRSKSHAVRTLNLFSNIKIAVERLEGTVTGVGRYNAIYIQLADGRKVVAYPTVGVPTAVTLQEAILHSEGTSTAIIFDHLGLHHTWIDHLKWLSQAIPSARWVKVSDAAWDFADWEAA